MTSVHVGAGARLPWPFAFEPDRAHRADVDVSSDERPVALRAARRRSLLVLYPLAVALLAAAIIFNARADAIGIVFVTGLLLLVVGWNAYNFLVWRPTFERRFPTNQT